MLKGVNLTLMIGPGVPIPVSKDVIEALTSVEVTNKTDGPSLFQLKFTLNNKSPLQTIFLLAGGATPPLMRVVIIATVSGQANVLIDGVITDHQVQTGDTGGESTLTITDEDLTRVMDYFDLRGFPFPAMSAEMRVLLILAKYAFLGIVPLVIPTVLMDVPIPTDRIPMQEGKDLPYIKQLADEAGYVFYIEPTNTPGVNTAYWGPEIKVGVPQPALNGDMDAHANVESISFNIDTEKKVQPLVYIHSQALKTPIPVPVPGVSLLNPPLGAIPPIPKKFEQLDGTARLSPMRAAMVGLTRASNTEDVIEARGSLDVLRYGRILEARKLVGVRGVGAPFNGLYFVKSVKHKIKRGEYKQDFTMSRNALVSTLAKVPV
jgi:hypothetical protein